MGSKGRALKAFRVTRHLGLPDHEVYSVLQDLLELYNWNWEPIEAEDYRALIDAYFELKENQGVEDEKEGKMVHDGSKRPSKKLQFGVQADHASSKTVKSSKMLALEKAKMPLNTSAQGSMGLSKLCSTDRKIESSSQLREMQLHRELTDPNSTPTSKENTSTSHCNKELIMSKTEKCDDASGCNGNTSRRNHLNIASSNLGEVNLSLNCTSALPNLNFQCPDFDAVLEYLEENLKTEKIVSSQFSMKKLLKDLCDSYLELGKSTGGSIIKSLSPEVVKTDEESFSSRRLKKRASGIGNSETDLNKKGKKGSGILDFYNFVKVQQHTVTSDQKKLFHSIDDITRGTENVKISLVDEFGNEYLPNFNYMRQNTVYQNAYIHISLARISDEDCCSSCSGDCLSSSIPCACARETGGEFAYTQQGLLKEEFLDACMSMESACNDQHLVYCQDCPLERSKNEHFPEPCQGHIIRKFIKECWTKCSCDMDCGNRIVQRGITCELQVFSTREGKGWGLRTLKDLPKGTFVCEYVGEILTNTELYERNMQSGGTGRHTYPVTLDADWGSEKVLRDEEALCLDATFAGNVARFINHRCVDANLIDIPVEVETPDHHYYHLALFTTRKVNALEELTWDYGIDFSDHNHPIKAFKCRCGSAVCRDMKRNKI